MSAVTLVPPAPDTETDPVPRDPPAPRASVMPSLDWFLSSGWRRTGDVLREEEEARLRALETPPEGDAA